MQAKGMLLPLLGKHTGFQWPVREDRDRISASKTRKITLVLGATDARSEAGQA